MPLYLHQRMFSITTGFNTTTEYRNNRYDTQFYFIKLMLLGLSIAVSAMMIEIGKNRIRWYKWRSQGTEPIVIVGELVKLVRLEDKKAGRQILHISSTEQDIALYSRLSKTQQQTITRINHKMNILFVPSPFWNPFVSKLK